MERSVRFCLLLTCQERRSLKQLAEREGGLSQAAMVRHLVRSKARSLGLWPPSGCDGKVCDCTDGEVNDDS